MPSESFRKIEYCLRNLEDPHVYGWSFYPYTKDIASEYKTLGPDEKQAVWQGLIRPLLTGNDEKELSIALQVCSQTDVSEAKEVLLGLFERKEITENWRLLFDLLIALGRLKSKEVSSSFQRYARAISKEDPNASRVAVAAILAISELDLSQALVYLPLAFRGDMEFRGDLSHPGLGYRNSDVLLEELLRRYGESAVRLIVNQLLCQDSKIIAFGQNVLDILLSRNEKLIQDFKNKEEEEFFQKEKKIQTLLKNIRNALNVDIK